MIKIIRHQYIDDLRRYRNIAIESFDEEIYADLDLMSLEQTMIRQEEIEHCWQQLNCVEREALFLWAVEGFTATEISVKLKVPRGTILARIARARNKMIEHNVTSKKNKQHEKTT